MASTGFPLADAVLERFAGALGGDREGSWTYAGTYASAEGRLPGRQQADAANR